MCQKQLDALNSTIVKIDRVSNAMKGFHGQRSHKCLVHSERQILFCHLPFTGKKNQRSETCLRYPPAMMTCPKQNALANVTGKQTASNFMTLYLMLTLSAWRIDTYLMR